MWSETRTCSHNASDGSAQRKCVSSPCSLETSRKAFEERVSSEIDCSNKFKWLLFVSVSILHMLLKWINDHEDQIGFWIWEMRQAHLEALCKHQYSWKCLHFLLHQAHRCLLTMGFIMAAVEWVQRLSEAACLQIQRDNTNWEELCRAERQSS